MMNTSNSMQSSDSNIITKKLQGNNKAKDISAFISNIKTGSITRNGSVNGDGEDDDADLVKIKVSFPTIE